ncbi:DUF433 domain-containing protein [Nostoc sp. CHAB 5714]|uniref:DUF433 domain-containing protein n=1 Tax=Nostoc favosum CHAB5714 TaxID=2780399 RepID=A0ABS8I416_9NOSO|nr:DUF433 domain-containing protein [Nostoc favosum CHAB5714]
MILELLSSGMSTEEILKDYDDLESEDILAVLLFAARLCQVKSIRPLAKVPNTPPPTPKSSSGGETKRSFGGVGFKLFDLCKRSIHRIAL